MLTKGTESLGTWLETTIEVGQGIYDVTDLTKNAIGNYSTVTKTNASVIAAQKGLVKWENVEVVRQLTLTEAQATGAGAKELKNINQGFCFLIEVM